MLVTSMPGLVVIGLTGRNELALLWVVAGCVAYLLGRRLKCPNGGSMATTKIWELFGSDLSCAACGQRHGAQRGES